MPLQKADGLFIDRRGDKELMYVKARIYICLMRIINFLSNMTNLEIFSKQNCNCNSLYKREQNT